MGISIDLGLWQPQREADLDNQAVHRSFFAERCVSVCVDSLFAFGLYNRKEAVCVCVCVQQQQQDHENDRKEKKTPKSKVNTHTTRERERARMPRVVPATATTDLRQFYLI